MGKPEYYIFQDEQCLENTFLFKTRDLKDSNYYISKVYELAMPYKQYPKGHPLWLEGIIAKYARPAKPEEVVEYLLKYG